jgi:Carboxypeptidase regulatory-like domain/TonB dependent receptor-like, beta-barrel
MPACTHPGSWWTQMLRNNSKLANLAVSVGAILLTVVSSLYAQISTATISGTVIDSQGAVLADTRIVVTNTETGIVTTSQTNASGAYTVPSLPIGNYRVEAQKDGFKTDVRGPFALTVGQQAAANFTLAVGQVSEKVQVSADIPTVETEDSSIGWLVGQQQVRDLPLNGRNFIQLTLLTPGVQPVPQETSEGAASLVPFGFGSPQRFSVAGGRPQGELFLLDGTDTAGVWGNGTGANLVGTTLGVDGIAEFEVLTDTYTAQYGGNGAVVNAAIRSGTNSYHGSGYEFARNSAMDARNFFDPLSGALPFSRNQFGGTFGGPIKQNKTFFFANFEGLRQSLTVPVTTQVPDQNFRNGYLPCAQTTGFTCDPTTGLANVGIDPNIASYLQTFPIPNGIELGNGSAYNNSGLTQPLAENYGVIRLDHTLSSSDSLFASYEIDDADLTARQDPVTIDDDTQRNQYLTFEERKVISPSMLNVGHLSYVRSNIDVATQYNPNLLIVPGSNAIGRIQVAGLATIGINDTAKELVNRFTFRDQLSWTKGRHSMQFGMEVVRHYVDADIPIVNGGIVAYNGVSAYGVESSYQAFLLNHPLAFVGVPTNANDSSRAMRHTNLSPYVQDKFQVNHRLVLNVGLRYDFETNPVEANDKLYNLINPATDAEFTHVSHAFAHNVTKWNFQPRVGFAWDVFGNQKTSVRGGFGAFADMPLEMQVAIAYLFNPPIYNVTQILFPTIPNPFGSGVVFGLPGGGQQTAYNPKMNDYIMEYNLNVQQEVLPHTVMTVGYVGSRANHLFIGQETNPCLPTSVLPDGTIVRGYGSNPSACPTVNPNLGSIIDRFAIGTSNYNSLEAAVDRGFGNNVQFRAAYTYSKCLDYGSYYTGNDSIGPNGQTAGLQAGNLANVNRNVDHGPCDFDLRHNFTSNVIWQLPFQGNRIKDGWQLSLIAAVHSGTPYSVYDGTDQADVGQAGAAAAAERPDLVPGRSNNPTGVHITPTGVIGFDATAFQLQPAGIFGNLGRNTLVAPGVRDFDFSVAKATKVTERTSAQLRLDIFNLANHTNFGFPNAALYTLATPGIITSTATTSRQLQLSAKFTF